MLRKNEYMKTVQDLINDLNALSDANKTLLVKMEGCDCYQEYGGKIDVGKDCVYIRNENGSKESNL